MERAAAAVVGKLLARRAALRAPVGRRQRRKRRAAPPRRRGDRERDGAMARHTRAATRLLPACQCALVAAVGAIDCALCGARQRTTDRMGRRAALDTPVGRGKRGAPPSLGEGSGWACDAVPRGGQIRGSVPSARATVACAASAAQGGARSRGNLQSWSHVRGVLSVETRLADFIRDTADGRDADAILRACVHCGFCTATCPTYQLLGDELDGPRGRIYLIKQVLEGAEVTRSTQQHLDRCLTCLNCQTTCPSGVEYGHLVDIGRKLVEARVPRPPVEKALRWSLRSGLTSSWFAPALRLGQALRPVLPKVLRDKVPVRVRARPEQSARTRPRKVLILQGCVQPAMLPNIDAALARALDRVGISLLRVAGGGCCGAVSEHLGAREEAAAFARRNIDSWWPQVENGAEAIVVTASACGVAVKDYGHLLRDDPEYADKARRVGQLARDPVEVIADEWKQFAPLVAMDHGPQRVAFHSPCTLQHGQKLDGRVEEILEALGLELAPVADGHLCCGSAGTYSILQPELSQKLKVNKLEALVASEPDMIATANIGCLNHLATGTKLPVRHWVEIFDARLRSRS